jgi:hypothetical protein
MHRTSVLAVLRAAVPSLALAVSAGLAQAQTITGAKAEPAAAAVGQEVTITVDMDVMLGKTFCGIRLRFSDGSEEQYHKINQAKDVPLVVRKAFDKPGEHTVYVEPRTKMPTMRCAGGDRTVVVKVE